jgi:TRAP-type C4-dicarboxylate transport system permease small subunit
MNVFTPAYRVFGWLKLAGAIVSGVAIFGMMLFIVYDVVGRNLLGGSIRGGFEIVQNYFMPLSIFPALGYVYASGILPKMDMVMDRVPQKLQSATVYVLLLAELVIFSLLFYFTWDYATAGMDRGMSFPAAGTLYQLWPLLFLVPFGVALIVVETLFALAHNLLNRDAPPSMNLAEPSEMTDL